EPDGSKSRSRNLSYDAERNLFILETSGAKSNRPEVWTYRVRNAPPEKRPAPPSELRVVTDARGKVRRGWRASASARRYEVERSVEDHPWATRFARVGTADGPSFEDADLKQGQVCFYRVVAVAADGSRSLPSEMARTQPRVLAAPVVSVLSK